MNNPITSVTAIHCSGILLSILNKRREMGITELQSVSNFDEKCLYMTLGYLVKEGAILIFERESYIIVRLLKQ